MNRIRRHRVLAALGSVSAALMLCGCSIGGTVYEFDSASLAPQRSIKVTFPDEVLDTEVASSLLLRSVIITGSEMKSSPYCAADLELEYGSEGIETLTLPEYTREIADGYTDGYTTQMYRDFLRNIKYELEYKSKWDSAENQNMRQAIDESLAVLVGSGNSADSVERILDDVWVDLERVALDRYEVASFSELATSDQWDNFRNWLRNGIEHSDFLDLEDVQVQTGLRGIFQAGRERIREYWDYEFSQVEAVPKEARLARILGLPEGRSVSELESDSPELGTFISGDFTEMKVITPCGSAPTDGGQILDLYFHFKNSGGSAARTAEIEFSLNDTGEVIINSGEVGSYLSDALESWNPAR